MMRFVALFMLVILVGCSASTENQVGPKSPPLPLVSSHSTEVKVTRGTYCWTDGCFNYPGLTEMLKQKESTAVSKNDVLTIKFKDFPPDRINIYECLIKTQIRR